MQFETKYKIALWKSYIDRGRGLTSYFNELFLIFGFWNVVTYKSSLYLILIIFFYIVFCYFLGWMYYKFEWQKAEIEVQNRYNLFVRELRDKFIKKKE